MNIIQQMMSEKTLVVLKPDAVKRGLTGTILQRFEQVGLKMVACKLVLATIEKLEGHFPKSEAWIRGMGEKTLETYKEYKMNPFDTFGTKDAFEIGKKIKEWNYEYMRIGPLMILILQGIHAIDNVRKIIGHTLPYKAAPGTIRGDFSINAPDLANIIGSACKNLIHASGNKEEAEQEIKNWFSQEEILDWQPPNEFLHFIQGEFTKPERKNLNGKYFELEQKLESLKEDPRNAAEYAYVLAVLYKNDGNVENAIYFGNQSISLFDKVEMNTLENCSARNSIIQGIVIPDLIHQDVVKERLQPLVLK